MFEVGVSVGLCVHVGVVIRDLNRVFNLFLGAVSIFVNYLR